MQGGGGGRREGGREIKEGLLNIWGGGNKFFWGGGGGKQRIKASVSARGGDEMYSTLLCSARSALLYPAGGGVGSDAQPNS